MTDSNAILTEMNDRSREVFRRVVEGYLDNGEPVGSRTLTRDFSEKISAATIRNVMQDLEYMGLLGSPHISAGRIPTKQEAPIKHIEFVSLSPDRALVVLVFANGHVENRIFTPPIGQTPSSLREAANFLNSIMQGHTLSEARNVVDAEIKTRRQELDTLAQELVETGAALWENEGERHERLIVRGRSNLLANEAEEAELFRIKELFDDLERKRDIADFLELTQQGDGVRIFIGSENKLFSLSGSSLVVSPYMNADRKIIGAVGVIGPTRLNYGRIVPIVDYTAQLVGKMIADQS
ncbi:MAG: heat-inducible transcriptional repressor HrcA [Rhodobacteraceae bacterium]|nr:heat-inducible transcriptional repressor HrcA [Paracoccaceae bacterium]